MIVFISFQYYTYASDHVPITIYNTVICCYIEDASHRIVIVRVSNDMT